MDIGLPINSGSLSNLSKALGKYRCFLCCSFSGKAHFFKPVFLMWSWCLCTYIGKVVLSSWRASWIAPSEQLRWEYHHRIIGFISSLIRIRTLSRRPIESGLEYSYSCHFAIALGGVGRCWLVTPAIWFVLYAHNYELECNTTVVALLCTSINEDNNE